MPFKSRAQQEWMYKNKPQMAKEWQKETPNEKLPERITPTRKAKALTKLKKGMQG